MNTSTQLQKAQLRQSMRVRRHALSSSEQKNHSLLLLQQLLRYSALQRSRDIAIYLASDGEADPSRLAAAVIRLGKRLWLPCIEGDRNMVFRQYRPGDPLFKNRYGIGQPSPRARSQAALQLDLVLLPLVAFDRSGNRLGMGGGFYDRCFHRCRRRSQRPLLLGLAHSFQEVEQLPRDHWDIPLAAVVTEREIIATRYRA